jgi:hypothetical protein
VLFLHNTSRVEDEPYPTLLRDKGFGGFPSLCFMDAEGNVLAKPPQRTVASYQETAAGAQALLTLRNKGAKRTPAEEKELFLTELRLDLIPAAEIAKRGAAIPSLSDEEKAAMQQKIVDSEYAALMGKMREIGPEALATQVAEMAKANRIPSGRNQTSFWTQVLTHAAKQKDVALAEQAFAKAEEASKTMPPASVERMRQNWQKLLDEAKAK